MNLSFDFEQDNTSHNKNNDMQAHLHSQDEVINTTRWTPLKREGQNFKSHTMVREGDERLVFKQSLTSKLFYGLLVLIGTLAIVVSLFGRMLGMSGSGSPLAGVAIGFLFIAIGIYFYRKENVPITLDRRLNAMWKGNIDPEIVLNKKSIDGFRDLKNLHAVQVIQERIESDSDEDGQQSRYYYSYEINLVFSDGGRLNVLDHGDKKAIDRQAAAIASLFDVVLWDGCRNAEKGWTERFVSVFRWIGGVIMLIVVGLFLYQFYSNYNESVQEEQRPKTMSPQEAALLSEHSSAELLTRTRDANISLPYVAKLMRQGAYVDTKDELGRTPLFYAVMQKKFDLVTNFLRQGADLNVVDSKGKRLLDLLDPLSDKFLYYYLVDAALHKDAERRGKQIISIERKFDASGKATFEKVNER